MQAGYDGQSDYRQTPQQQPRGRGQRSRQPNLNSNAYYQGQSHVSQQIPSHLQQQLPSQQHMSHQLPGGQQHVSQQGGRQSSQHVSSQSSPPMAAQSHPQTQDLPRYGFTQIPRYTFTQILKHRILLGMSVSQGFYSRWAWLAHLTKLQSFIINSTQVNAVSLLATKSVFIDNRFCATQHDYKTERALVEDGCCAVLLFQISARLWALAEPASFPFFLDHFQQTFAVTSFLDIELESSDAIQCLLNIKDSFFV